MKKTKHTKKHTKKYKKSVKRATNKRKSRKFVKKIGSGLCESRMCPPASTLWSQDEFNNFKSYITPIKASNMKKGERYFIETYPGEYCHTFETGVFDNYFSQGIYSGGIFRKMKLLYKSPIEGCEDWPGSYTQPIYSSKINPVTGDNDKIGRTGEIRIQDQYVFYKWKNGSRTQNLIRDKMLPSLPLPLDVTGNIREFL